jgi:hypothetical protein
MKVIDFVKNKAVKHSLMNYCEDRKSFTMDVYYGKNPGIYFILDGNNILKVGKADGKNGLQGRLSSYRGRLSSRSSDYTVQLIYAKMTGPLKNKTLEMWVYELKPVILNVEGFEVEAQMARSLESKLSLLARNEGHTLELSGQN